MKSPRATPSKNALLLASRAQRKQEKADKQRARQQLIDDYAALVDAEVSAGIRPPGSSRCLPWDRHGIRAESNARREAKWWADEQARTEKRAARAAKKAASKAAIKPTSKAASKPTSKAAIKAANRAAEKARWHEYEDRVRELTEQLPLHLVPGIALRGQDYHLDHKLAVKTCYRLDIPPEECATIENVQILSRWENFRKGTACYSSLEAHRLQMAA